MTEQSPAADTVTDATPDPVADTASTVDEVAKWKALARKHEAEVKALRPKAAKADELEESQKSEVEKATARAAEAEARAAALERNAARDRIARDKGLGDFAEFLTGDTEDDITAAADRLAALIPPRAPGRPVETLQRGNTPPAAASTSSPDDWIRQAVSARHSGR